MTIAQRTRTAHGVKELSYLYSRFFTGIAMLSTRYRYKIMPIDQIIRWIRPPCQLLDIGCGNGLFLYMLASQNKVSEAFGVDNAGQAISKGRIALERAGVENCRLQLTQSWLDWPEGPFDAVTMIDVIHHISPSGQEPSFKKACRLVRNGGLLIYKDIAARPAWSAWANRLHDLLLARQWINYVDPALVTRWAEETGLSTVEVKNIRMLWYTHDLLVFKKPS